MSREFLLPEATPPGITLALERNTGLSDGGWDEVARRSSAGQWATAADGFEIEEGDASGGALPVQIELPNPTANRVFLRLVAHQ